MTQRQLQILLAIGSPLLLAWCIYDFAGMVRHRDTRYIVEQMNAAENSLEHSPPGIERADEFVRRLKKIDTAHAPTEVKQALADYATAMEEGLAVLRAQKDATSFDRVIAEKKQSLLIAVEKYR
ncbi:MAG TPA: hypothetical protein VK961_20795 [Chthoniobacter sp.]|nr:hypothetical protein [Chthoniobacter sp.]